MKCFSRLVVSLLSRWVSREPWLQPQTPIVSSMRTPCPKTCSMSLETCIVPTNTPCMLSMWPSKQHPGDLIWQWRRWFVSITCSNLLSACNPSMSGSEGQDYMPEVVLAGQCYTRTMVPNMEYSSAGESTRHHEGSLPHWIRSAYPSCWSCFRRNTVWSSWFRHPDVSTIVLLLLS